MNDNPLEEDAPLETSENVELNDVGPTSKTPKNKKTNKVHPVKGKNKSGKVAIPEWEQVNSNPIVTGDTPFVHDGYLSEEWSVHDQGDD